MCTAKHTILDEVLRKELRELNSKAKQMFMWTTQLRDIYFKNDKNFPLSKKKFKFKH